MDETLRGRRVLFPARRALRYILAHRRRHGLRTTLRTLVTRCLYGREEFVIIRTPLAGPPVADRMGDIAFRLAAAADLDRLEEFDRHGRKGRRLRALVEEDGDWLFVACHADQIVATRAMSPALPPYGLLGKVIQLRPGEVVGAGVFCVPDYRGKRIAEHLCLFSERHLASLGYTDLVGTIAADNVASLKMHLRKGVRFTHYVSYSRLLFRERLRVTEDVPDLV